MRRREFISGSLAALSVSATSLEETDSALPALEVQSPVRPANRASATAIVANARRIVTPHGVERLETLKLGGIEQWISVRGADKRNPILLLIHGGPGYISIPTSWWFTRGWEEYFTVVQWDQRGAGKTYLLNDPPKIANTMTRDRMLTDVEELVEWVCRELEQEKLFVIGHSWGSYLGLQLAVRHPKRLHAYIGVGQLTDGPESERRGWTFTQQAAQAEGNQEALRELQAIAPYFAAGRLSSLKDIYVQRKWLDFYGGVMAYRKGNSDDSDLVYLSSDYTDAEIAHIWEGNAFSERYLLQEVLGLDLSSIRKFECPILILAGRHDVNVNSDVAARWFATVEAPSKQFIWFENSAHLPMTEQPGQFLFSLVYHARSLAEKVAASAIRISP